MPDALTQGLLKGAKLYWAELFEAAQAEVDRRSRDHHELKNENPRLAILSGNLQSRVDAGEARLTEVKQDHATLIREKDTRTADLSRERAAAEARNPGRPKTRVTK